jgi:hypothetical protein
VKWITAQDLERWADRIASRSDILQLVSDLIRASAADISSIRFLKGDSSQMHGWDGHLISTGAPPYISVGESGWEFGTSAGVETKADEDYEARLKKSEPVDKLNATFVFVTPRRWKDCESWAKDKLSQGKWKDVKAFDAIALEDWLHLCPAVALRLARDLGLMPTVGVHCTDQLWDEYAKQFKPDLTEDVLLADRTDQMNTILSQMRTGQTSYVWQGDSTDEVVAFAVAAIRKAELDVRRFIEDRTLIIDTSESARQLEHLKNLVLLLGPDAHDIAGTLSQRNLVIVPIGRDNPVSGGGTLLEQQNVLGLATALQTMGLSEDEARSLALKCGRSVTILGRQIPSAVARKPHWAGDRNLIPALLAGSWSDKSDHDKRVIAELAGVADYSEYEDKLLPFLRKEDSPLIKEADAWQVRAPIDAFKYLGHLVSRRDFERLRAVATTVFSETDPRLDLPDSERLYGEIYGKNFQHSKWLRDGVARTLRIVAILHGPLGVANTAVAPDQFVNQLIAELPGLATDYRRMASLYEELPILMEAAPRPLLLALGQMLGGDGKTLAPIFQDEDPFLSRSPHTGLLWALEALAWDPKHLSESALILAKLARVDPGGKLSNRPLNSLREILLPWHPGTNANLVQRLAVLDQIIATEPEIGWQLLMKILPGLHEVAFPTAKPRYLEAGASERETLTYGLVADGRRGIVERAMSQAGENPERWVQLIKEISQFEEAQRVRAAELLELSGARLDGEKRTVIWTALRSFVAHQKAFPTAAWALKAEDLEPFQRLVVAFEPADPIARIVWLFDEWNPAVPQQAEWPCDLPEKTRESTIRDLLKTGGLSLLPDLASAAKHAELVGTACGAVLTTLQEFRTLVDAAMDKTDRLALFASVLSAEAERQMGKAWHDQISSWKRERSWTDLQFANLVINWQDQRTTWDFVASLGGDVNRIYWERKRPWAPRGLSAEDAEMAAKSYISVGRATAAIHAFALNVGDLSSETLFKILDSAIRELNASPEEINSNFVFEIEQILGALQQRTEVPITEIAKREYAYLPLFGYRDRQLTLHRVMAEDPTFFASLIHDAFKPHNREVPEPTEAQKATARAAYRLVNEFTAVPGVHDGQIDAEILSAWIEVVRAIAKEDDRSEIADEFIGHLLAYAPPDPDGAWPHRVVRDLIEEVSSAHLETGIDTERFNMAGRPHARALYGGGSRERGIAEQFRDWSKKAGAWPRTSAMLERIAESWDRFAAAQDERAKQDRMRDEA